MPALSPADLVVVFGYFLIVLWVGIYSKRSQTTAEDYFAGDHQVPWWLAGISHYMSGFSAFTFVVYSEMAYRYGLVAILLYWTSVPACMLGARFLARRWRRARIITPVEFLEQRCNLAVRQLFAWAAIPAKIFEDSLKIFTTALFLAAAIGVDIRIAILLCGAIVILYTLLGGLLALVVTDYIQFIMKSLAILLLLPMAILRAGGPAQAFTRIPNELWHWTNGPYGWSYLVGYAILVAISYNGNWSFAQKFYSVPDEKAAEKAGYLAALLNFVGTPIMLLPAFLGRHLLPNLLVQNRTSDVYIQLIFTLLPAGMIGIIIAALFSATMATVSSDLNAIAGVLTKDFWQRLLRPNANEKELLFAGRSITGILGALIVGFSLWISATHRESLFQLMVTAFGLLLAPTLLPLLALLSIKRLNSRGVFAGFAAGLLSGIVSLLVRQALSSHGENFDARLQGLSIIASTLITCAAMLIASRLFTEGDAERKRAEVFFQKLDTPVDMTGGQLEKSSIRNSIIAGATTAVGALLIAAGFLAQAKIARGIDLSLGVTLSVTGSIQWKRSRREGNPPAKQVLAESLETDNI